MTTGLEFTHASRSTYTQIRTWRSSALRLCALANGCVWLVVFLPPTMTSAWAAPCQRDSIVIAVEQNPPLLDPVGATTSIAYRVIYSIFDPLIWMDYGDGFKLKPGLATGWQRIDDRTVDLSLRENVRYQDGSPLTAASVAFSFSESRLGRPGSPLFALSRPFLGTIASVVVIDSHTVRFIANGPDPLLEYRLAGWMSQPVSQAAFEAASGFDVWARAPVGTGPYRVHALVPGDRIELIANDDYWRGIPRYRSITFQVVPEQAARVAGLVSGRYDLITNLDPDLFDYVLSYPELDVVGGPVGNHRLIAFGTKHTELAKPAIRRAMSLAIDRDLLVRAFWRGLVSVSPGMQSETFGDMFVGDYRGVPYDPARARALISSSGYQNQEIRYLIQKNAYTAELMTSEAIVAMWRDVGLNVRLEIKDNWGQILTPASDFVFNTSVIAIYPDPIGQLWRYFGEHARVQKADVWTNDAFNRNGRLMEKSADASVRREAFRRMLEIAEWEDPAYAVLHTYSLFYGKRRGLEWAPIVGPFMQFPVQADELGCEQ